jgi:hypothetical protein
MSEKKSTKKVEKTSANNTPTQEELQSVQERLFVLTPAVQQSIDILIQCANIAQRGGLLSLQDASYANQAVTVMEQFLPQPAPAPEEVKLEATEEENNAVNA